MFLVLLVGAHILVAAMLVAIVWAVRRWAPDPIRAWSFVLPALLAVGLLAVLIMMPHIVFPR